MNSIFSRNRQGLVAFAMGLALFFIIPSFLRANPSKISFVTKLPKEGKVSFAIFAKEEVKALGLKEPLQRDGIVHSYTLERQDIQLVGSILEFCIKEQQLTSLDIRQAKELRLLDCSNNLIEQLNLSRSASLQVLNCSNNALTKLQLPKQSALKSLRLAGNSIPSLSLEMCSLLEELDYSGNYYPTSIDLSYCPELKILHLEGNKFRQVSLKANPKIEICSLDENELRSIDIANLESLKELSLARNINLRTISWGKHPNLEKLDLFSTAIAQLDLAPYTKLTTLHCSYSQLTTLDVSHNKELRILSCGKNPFRGLDVSKNILLEELGCNDLAIEQLDLKNNPQLKSLTAHHNALSALDLSKNPLLKELNVADNKLSQLEIESLTQLETLIASNNKLQDIKLPPSSSLCHLELYSNKLPQKIMQRLANFLPDRVGETRGLWKVVDTKNKAEENRCSQESVKIAVNKNWRVVDYANFAKQGKGYDYRGFDAPSLGDGVVTLTFKNEGSRIKLLVETLGEIKMEGIVENGQSDKEPKEYTLKGKELWLKGDIYRLALYEGTLEKIQFMQCRYLRELTINNYTPPTLSLPLLPNLEILALPNNALTAVNLQGVPLLSRMVCYGNYLSEEEGLKMIEMLPQKAIGETAYLLWRDSQVETETKNALSKKLIQMAKEKGWIVTDYKGGILGENGEPIVMETAIETPQKEDFLSFYREADSYWIETTPQSQILVYDINGRVILSSFADTEGKARLSLRGVSSGIYFFVVGKSVLKILIS